MLAEAGEPFAVGDWLVEPALNRVSCGDLSLHLRSQVMEVLVYLAGRNGRVATLESIHDDLWAGKVVSSGTIYNCIAELRQALAKSGSGIEYIETLPKKGYRLSPQALTLRPTGDGQSRLPSIAILPLVNSAASPEIDYLCQGISDEILHGLSRVDGLRVHSARALKDPGLDPRVAGLRFGARLVLSGSLQARGKLLRAYFRLETVSDGNVVWSGRYEHGIDDLFELQESVAREVVAAVAPALSGEPATRRSLEGSGTASLDAMKAFLLGRHALSQSTYTSHKEAIRYFDEAVARDPAFARAHYWLYLACYLRCRSFGVDDGSLERARVAAAEARALGYRPAVPWVHVHRRLHPEARLSSRGLALEAIEKLVGREPEWSGFALEQLAWTLADAGLFDAALAFARKLLASAECNLEDSDADEEIPGYAAACGRLDDAIGLLSGLIQKDPARPAFRCERAILYARTGQFHYAEKDIAGIRHRAFLQFGQAFLAWYRGDHDATRRHHDELLTVRGLHPLLPLHSCCLLGELDRSLDYYEQAVCDTARTYIDFGIARVYTRARLPSSLVQAIESHPRFLALMASQGIDEAWRRELAERVNAIAAITGIAITAPEAAA